MKKNDEISARTHEALVKSARILNLCKDKAMLASIFAGAYISAIEEMGGDPVEALDHVVGAIGIRNEEE